MDISISPMSLNKVRKEKPETWNMAASYVVGAVVQHSLELLAYAEHSSDLCQREINIIFEQLVGDIFDSKEIGMHASRLEMFETIGANGLIGYANETKVSVKEAGMHLLNTVVGKQRMYGHGNISRFGVPGLAIRLNDKLERLKNLQKHDGPVLFEPIHDTWLDICGYSVIAFMWVNDWFMLELEAQK